MAAAEERHAGQEVSGWLSTASVGFRVRQCDGGCSEDAGRRVRLRPQPARALAHLLMRHGEFVSRAELQRAIWPDGTFVHFDYGLNSCMKQIRAALGDNPLSPRLHRDAGEARLPLHRPRQRDGRVVFA